MKKMYKAMTAALAALILLTSLLFSAAAAETSPSPIYSADDLFTSRDLTQEPNLSKAVSYTLTSGEDIHITEAGTYVLTGTAENATVYVEAGKDDKVQLVLDGLTVANGSFPVIYAKTADKVFVTTTGDSALSVTGSFTADNDVKTDGVIFSKCDLVLNGAAKLTVVSTDNGIVCKDDLKITGGEYQIQASSKAVEANDSIRVKDGVLNLTAGADGLHAENEDDNTLGYVYIGGGSITIQAGDDGIHATSVVQIDGGDLNIRAAEGIEATYVQLNGGSVNIQATDDGINAAKKSSAYTPTVEINGGDITVSMGQGDTDGIDSNGNIIVNGGKIQVTGNSTFDYDGSAQYNGGTIIVNGQEVAYIPNQMMGGRGGFGGNGFGGNGFGGNGFDGNGFNGGFNGGFGNNENRGGRGGRGR